MAGNTGALRLGQSELPGAAQLDELRRPDAPVCASGLRIGGGLLTDLFGLSGRNLLDGLLEVPEVPALADAAVG